MAVKEKHSHYYKNVGHLTTIDIYRVLERFGVTDPTIQHAVKKLLVAGGRGAGKDQDQDVQEAIDSLMRFQEMRQENAMENRGGAVHITNVIQPQLIGEEAERSSEAIRRFLEKDPRAILNAVCDGPRRVKAPSAPKPPARRKATKRAAKAAPRRGR